MENAFQTKGKEFVEKDRKVIKLFIKSSRNESG